MKISLLNSYLLFLVDLREVRDIRCGKASKDFEKWPVESKLVDTKLCFIVFYGQEFKLKRLSVTGRFYLNKKIIYSGLSFVHYPCV